MSSKHAGHHQHRDSTQSKRALMFAIVSTASIFGLEFAGGLWTRSLALLSDSAHVLMDLLSFALSYAALLLAERPISDKRTFGWHRMEVFAALANGITVVGIAVGILAVAYRRLSAPQDILAPQMLAIAILGLLVNLFVIWRLHPHVGTDLNIRSAFLHAFGDAAASVAVVGGGVFVLITGQRWVDPVVAMVVALIILGGAYRIFSDSVHILLEGVPRHVERGRISEMIESVAGAGSVRDLHIWNLCSHISALSAHIVVRDESMPRQREMLQTINSKLEKTFNIVHTTIQIESESWHHENRTR